MVEAAPKLLDIADPEEKVRTSQEKKYGDTAGLAGFTFTNYAFRKVSAKLKRKGIAEAEPRANNMYGQFLVNSLAICSATSLVAPLERARILIQTKHIARPEYQAQISDSAIENIRHSIKQFGLQSQWRGNTALIYKNLSQLSLKLIFYDKFKHYFMPYDPNKYSSLQYFFRTVCASLCSMTFAFCFTYPFDVIHTRSSADLSANGKSRIYPSTFQCFNLTHIDEGTYSLYKGAGFAITSSILRAGLTIPVYELFQRFKSG